MSTLKGALHSCVVYNGIRPKDIKQVYKENINADGYGIFFLPKNSELTEEQKIACKKLLDSNHSLFGNHEKIELSYGYISGGEITRSEFENVINIKVQKIG